MLETFLDKKTDQPSINTALIRGRYFSHNLTQKEKNKNNIYFKRERQARELHAFKKHTTLLPPKEEAFNLTEKMESTKLKLYVLYVGRTGNNLLQYVSGLGIAHTNNNRSLFFNPKMNKLKEIFPKIEMNFLNYVPKWPLLCERKKKAFDPIFLNLPKKYLKVGYAFHSFKYFQDIFGDIYNRTLSYFDEDLLTKAKKFIQGAKFYYKLNDIVSKETNVTSVCIHVRRDDFLSEHSKKVGFLVPSSLDIHNAMNYLQNKFKHIVFIVISNGLNWCKVNLNRSNVYFSNFSSANEDFVLMCSCDHMIMTVGTFGFWGSWFTSWRGGIAMYYEHVFSEKSNNVKSLSRHDWYPPHWLAYTNRTITESRYLGDKLTTNLNS